MLKFITTNQFEKDYCKALKSGKDEEKIKRVILKLLNNESLEPKYQNHKLKGNYKDRWEYHIEPDWLMIYKKTKEAIFAERTGSHSELFKK